MKKFSLTIIAAALSVLPLFAQINIESPNVVGLNERFNVTFVLSEKPSDFNWEPGDGFQLVWGPQTGSSVSVSIVNGKTTKDSRYTFTYILSPRGNGSFSLPAAHAVVDGQDVYSRNFKIEVVSDGASSSGGQQSGTSQSSSSAGQAGSTAQQGGSSAPGKSTVSASSDLFMRFSLSRTNVVMGEPITATLKLYTRENISGFEDARFPTFNGFWAQEIESPQNINFVRESVGDKIYNSAVLRKWVIIPQKSGTIKIDPAELVCLSQERISSGNSIFDGFFDDYRTVRKKIVSASYSVKVSPLPSGAPASFTGAVGSYTISASLSADSLKVHDAASLTVKVSGKGNVALVGAPKVKFPPDNEVYDTKTSERLDAGSGGMSGSKTFEYPFIPRSHGDFTVGPVEFSYYDVSSRKYVTVSAPAIHYSVARGEASDYVSPSGIAVPQTRGRDVKDLAQDIHYIDVKEPVLRSEGKFFAETPLFWSIFALMLLFGGAVCFIVLKVRKDRSDVVLVRTRSASKVARKRLSAADAYLKKNLYSAFYEELHKALLGYASDKLNISAADLSKESISDALERYGASDQMVAQYVALLDECEFARYSPNAGSSAMQESYDKAVDIISLMDSNMKKNPRTVVKAVMFALMLVPAFGGNDVSAQNNEYVDTLWMSAVNAYANENFLQARRDFQTIVDLGFTGAELYTNLADACYKNGELGNAVLFYEKALKSDPSFKDARYNLEIARAHTQDRIESVPEFFLLSWNRSICYWLSSDVWAALFLVFVALVTISATTFILSRRRGRKIAGFSVSVALLLVAAVCLVNALWQKRDYYRKDSAVVTVPVCSAKSAPSHSTTDLFVIHEGTKVKVFDNVGEWTGIVLADGREGWVYSSSITVI